MPAVLFRCDGGPAIGLGHVMRCRALAGAFERQGWRSLFAVTQETASLAGPEATIVVPGGLDGTAAVRQALAAHDVACLVVDHYRLDSAFEREVTGDDTVVVAIDDLANRPHHCHVLVDSNPARKPADYMHRVPATTRLLLGPDYALLRSAFGEQPPRPLAATVETMVIAFGGADPDNASAHVVEVLPRLRRRAPKTVLIVGPAYQHRMELADKARAQGVDMVCNPPNPVALMAQADIAISGAGITCLEFLCLGVPTLAVILAENQRAVAASIGAAGAAWVVDRRDPQALIHAIDTIDSDVELRRRMSTAGRRLIDGHGARRVAEEVVRLVAARKSERCR